MRIKKVYFDWIKGKHEAEFMSGNSYGLYVVIITDIDESFPIIEIVKKINGEIEHVSTTISHDLLTYMHDVGQGNTVALLNINNDDLLKKRIAEVKLKIFPDENIELSERLQKAYDSKSQLTIHNEVTAFANILLDNTTESQLVEQFKKNYNEYMCKCNTDKEEQDMWNALRGSV